MEGGDGGQGEWERTQAGLCNHEWYQIRKDTFINGGPIRYITIYEQCRKCTGSRTTSEQQRKPK
jgi:hypothetical protein